MSGALERHRSDLTRLVQLGEDMLVDLSLRDPLSDHEHRAIAWEVNGCFEREYQRWFTEAAAVVDQLIPSRAAEFDELYRGNNKRKPSAAESVTIQDWLIGRKTISEESNARPLLAVSLCLKTQLEILKSAELRFDSSLFEIRKLVRADLFESEFDACRELAAHGFLRAAGTIAGVILEKHLRQAMESRDIVVRKNEPTINDFNDQLKKAGAFDVATWRKIQRLGDIRNLCGHSKHREPTPEEVDEIIEGTESIVRLL
jgi:hypothetical protein